MAASCISILLCFLSYGYENLNHCRHMHFHESKFELLKKNVDFIDANPSGFIQFINNFYQFTHQ